MTQIIHRRGLITGLGAIFAAPAIMKVASIMPIKVLDLPIPQIDIQEREYFVTFTVQYNCTWEQIKEGLETPSFIPFAC